MSKEQIPQQQTAQEQTAQEQAAREQAQSEALGEAPGKKRRGRHSMTPEEKYIKMTQTPVKRLIASLAVPTILSMLTTSIYNMADTFFVGQISTSASGAVGISFAVMALIQALGFMFGAGSGNYISRLLGAQERELASQVAATGFYSAFGLGVIFAVIGQIFIDPLVNLLGATPTIAPEAKSYLFYILLAMPFMASSLVLNNILRYQGSAVYGMVGIMAGGILNIALDPLFIFGFGMGTAGAALATAISQCVSFTILFIQCRRGGNIAIRMKNYRFGAKFLWSVMRGGMPSLYRQGMNSIATMALNNAARAFGDPAIAGMSIVTRIMGFCFSAMMGFGQGYQPVCGFNYGAKRYDRVMEGFWFCVVVLLGITGTLFVIGQFAAPYIIQIFRDDPAVVAVGQTALRYQLFALLLATSNVLVTMMLQTIGQTGRASILALGRQGLFFLPFILILPGKLGLLGVQLSQPLSDVCSTIFVLIVGGPAVYRVHRKKVEMEQAAQNQQGLGTQPEEQAQERQLP